MERLGTGKGVAALLNGRARHVSSKAVRALERALPDALILVSEDFEQARRHVARIVAGKPRLVLSGGGDGAIVRLLNFLREEGAHPLPALGVLKLGTGNGWARVCGAPDFFTLARALPLLPDPLPTRRFDLVEVEKTLCHFAGVGWDAKILNDYSRNLDKRSAQLVGSTLATRLHKGVVGYLYSTARITIPELMREPQPHVSIESLEGQAYSLDARGALLPIIDAEGGAPARKLHEGAFSIAAAGSTPEWGFGFRAFPFAQKKPGYINLRTYDRHPLEAARNVFKLWRGNHPQPGMTDFFVRKARLTFSRPVPFQIGGDPYGLRSTLDFSAAAEAANLVDWTAAMAETASAR